MEALNVSTQAAVVGHSGHPAPGTQAVAEGGLRHYEVWSKLHGHGRVAAEPAQSICKQQVPQAATSYRFRDCLGTKVASISVYDRSLNEAEGGFKGGP